MPSVLFTDIWVENSSLRKTIASMILNLIIERIIPIIDKMIVQMKKIATQTSVKRTLRTLSASFKKSCKSD